MAEARSNQYWHKHREELARYDWVTWFDGQVWELTPGEDFTISVKSFQIQAHNAARRGGYNHLRTWRRHGKFYLWLGDKVPVEEWNAMTLMPRGHTEPHVI